MKFTLFSMGLALLVTTGNASGELSANAISLSDTIVKPAAEILDVIQKYNLPLDTNACRDAIISSVTRVADPLSRVMTEADVTVLKESQQGITYEPAFEFAISNSLPRIAKLSFAPEIPGIQVGDLIEKIDDRELLTGMNPLAVTRLLRGGEASNIALSLRNSAGKTNLVQVPRTTTKLPAIEAVEELPVEMSYLRINGIFEGSGAGIAAQLRTWGAATNRYGVVIDLRGADGTDLASAAEIAGLFSEGGGLLFSIRDSADQDVEVFKSQPGKPLGMPAMVLVDGRTTGAAEVLAAVLSASVRGAMLIGNVTGGNPMVRELVPLPSGQKLYIATRRLVLADGKVYNGRDGLKPDILVDDADLDESEYEPDLMMSNKELTDEEKEDRKLRERVRHDTALRRAVDILLGLKALNIRGIGYSQEKTP